MNINVPLHFCVGALMMASTRRAVLSLYTRLFRIARTWQAQTGAAGDAETERKYIVEEARTLFRQNQQVRTAVGVTQILKNSTVYDLSCLL